MRLKDKIVLVTGSTTGIGEAIARRFVVEGARVMIHGLEPILARRVAESLSSNSSFFCNDLSKAESAAELIDATVKAFGRVEAIVNNAATVARSTLESTDAATFDRIIAINLRAPLLLIRAALPYLKAARGSILNIGSINAYCGAPNLLAYSISKGGLMTMSRNLADALCYDQVRVNQLNLGWVLSDNENKLMIASGLPADWAEHPPRSAAPSGKLIMPDQIATAAVYWISDESRPISGSVCEMEQFPVIGRNSIKEKH